MNILDDRILIAVIVLLCVIITAQAYMYFQVHITKGNKLLELYNELTRLHNRQSETFKIVIDLAFFEQLSRIEGAFIMALNQWEDNTYQEKEKHILILEQMLDHHINGKAKSEYKASLLAAIKTPLQASAIQIIIQNLETFYDDECCEQVKGVLSKLSPTHDKMEANEIIHNCLSVFGHYHPSYLSKMSESIANS